MAPADTPRTVWHPIQRGGPVDLETRGRLRSVGRGQGGLLLLRHPRGEGLRREDDGSVAHVGVGRAAELGALAVVLARRVGREDDAGHAAGNRIALAAELGHPEAVDDVGAGDLEAHRAAGREVEVAGGDDAELRVLELPPPLVPDDLHPEGVLRRRGLRPEDRPHGREGDERQDDRRDEGPDDLEQRAAPHLPWDRLGVALAEPDDRDQEEDLHYQEDRRVPPEDLHEDPVGGPAEVGSRRQRRRRRVQESAAGQHESDGQRPESRDPGRPHAPEGRFRSHVVVIEEVRPRNVGHQPSANARSLPCPDGMKGPCSCVSSGRPMRPVARSAPALVAAP